MKNKMGLMGNFTSLPANSNVVEYVFAFDNALKGYAIITMLLAILIVMAGGIYLWKGDFIDSSLFATFNMTFVAFLFTLIKSKVFMDGTGAYLRLLSFEKFTLFVVILVLLAIYKRVSDQ